MADEKELHFTGVRFVLEDMVAHADISSADATILWSTLQRDALRILSHTEMLIKELDKAREELARTKEELAKLKQRRPAAVSALRRKEQNDALILQWRLKKERDPSK
jgi:uncharacterized small protein (DUF1192 family)